MPTLCAILILVLLLPTLGALEEARTARASTPLVVTVGAPGSDIPQQDGRSIQMAIDLVAARGGGTVQVAAGDYLLVDALRMRSGVHLLGERGRTRLHRGALVWTRLAVDADKSERQMTPVDTSPWRPGMGVALYDGKAKRWSTGNLPLTITEIADGVCHLNDWLLADHIAEDGAIAANIFPLVLFDHADDAVIDGFEIDHAVDDPDGVLKGLNCDAVYLFRSQRARLAHLVVRNAQADGVVISSASCGVTVEDCQVLDSHTFGIHPGSHSTDVTIQRCTIRGSGADGLWVCWGVRRGRFIDNTITANGTRLYRSGVCIGHKDTDALFKGNHIADNRKHGIAFRGETEANGAHRAIIRGNLIENNGALPEGYASVEAIPGEVVPCGIAIDATTRDVVIEGNVIRETRSGEAARQRHAIWVAPESSVARLADNEITGHPDAAIVGIER